mmetsp:Transcript_5138/g.11176  ORF Transcript_5138/g.11176 Transcript_5138/m.11176 type:complete len:84 (-) Transcript_5138:16-267(-)
MIEMICDLRTMNRLISTPEFKSMPSKLTCNDRETTLLMSQCTKEVSPRLRLTPTPNDSGCHNFSFLRHSLLIHKFLCIEYTHK